MKKMFYFSYKQKGLSLLEMIISLSLGLIILLALGSIYQSASYSSLQSSDIIDMNAKANKIMYLLGQDFKQAGYIDLFDKNPIDENQSNAQVIFSANGGNVESIFDRTGSGVESPFTIATGGLFPIIGCDAITSEDGKIILKNKFSYEAKSGGGVALIDDSNIKKDPNDKDKYMLECGDRHSSNDHQSIEIAYQSVINKPMDDLSATGSGSAPQLNSLQDLKTEKLRFSSAGLDCSGNSDDKNNQKGFIRNMYYLDGDTFKCKGSSQSSEKPVELVKGIQQFVLRYRITPPSSGTGSAKIVSGEQTDKILSATDVLNSSLNPLGWYSVTGVQVCLLIKSDKLHKTNIDLAKLQPKIPSCTGQDLERSEGDKAYYKRYVSTFSLPNLINFTH